MKTYAEIVDEVRRELRTPEGRDKIRRRRKMAARMVQGLRRLNDAGSSYRKRTRDAVFTVTQDALCKAGSDLTVYVEVLGRRVGTLTYPATRATKPCFVTCESTPLLEKGARLIWSGDRRDGDRIKAYFEACATRPRSPERDAQGALVRAMFARGKHPLLSRLQPVRPAGCMMEIPAPVTSDGLGVRAGNVDVLVRADRGPSARFIVCEIKAPGLKTRPHAVMEQAIRYAAALDVEVNGDGEGGIKPADASVYRSFFGATGSARVRFGAMAAIYATDAAVADTVGLVQEAMRTLSPPPTEWLDAIAYTERASSDYEPIWRWSTSRVSAVSSSS